MKYKTIHNFIVFLGHFVIVRYMKTEIKKLEQSQVEISVTLPSADVEKYREAVTKQAIENIEVDGFRKGNVPENIAMKQINSMKVLEEMAQKAISAAYVDILQKESIKAIGHPEIMITKIAEGSDLEFKITTAVLPEIKVADYKKIAQSENATEYSDEVDEKEVADSLLNLRKMRAQQEAAQNKTEGDDPTSWNDIKEEDLPELSDDWVKTIGDFENVDALTAKIKENLVMEKQSKNVEKRRIATIDAILKDSEIEVPQMMIDYEVEKMMHEFENNITMSGMKFDDYLKSIEKTRDDYKKEWLEPATQRAQTQLLLNHIAAQESIDPSDEEVQVEVEKIMEQYKDQPGIDENNVRAYVASVLTHQKVFEFLESQK